MALWRTLMIALVLAESSAMASEPEPSSLVVFGDSLSDTHRTADMLQSLPFGIGDAIANAAGYFRPPYCGGRISNGQLWPEYLASRRKLELKNFALAGTGTRKMHTQSGLNIPGRGAISRIKQATRSEDLHSGSVAVLWTGGNNYVFDFAPKSSLLTTAKARESELVSNTIQDIEIAMRKIVQSGAKTLVIPNLPLGHETPYALQLPPGDRQALMRLTRKHNVALGDLMTKLKADPEFAGVQILPVDIASAMANIVQSPKRYGFTNVGECCHPTNYCPKVVNPALLARATCPPPSPIMGAFQGMEFLAPAMKPETAYETASCENPDQYFFFDAIHPTTKVHCLLSFLIEDSLTDAKVLSPGTSPKDLNARVDACSNQTCPND